MFFVCILLTYFVAFGDAAFCSSPEENTLYISPSPTNCSNFVACIDFEEYEFDCIQAPLFIPWSAEAACITPCSIESTTRKTIVKNNAEWVPDPYLFPDTPARTVICPSTGKTMAAVPQSCSEYLSCDNGIGTKHKCDVGFEFSPSSYQCVEKKNSDCARSKLKGSQHSKCRYDKEGGPPVYFQSDICPEFKKCASQLAWQVKCARYCHWNNEEKSCEWADKFECHLKHK